MLKKKQESSSFGVIGLGRFGTALAITLAQAGKEVIVVDRDETRVKELRQYTDYAFVADELTTETLKEIGIQNCDVAIICIGERVDASILTTMRIVEMGVPRVIAKAFSKDQGMVLERIGAEVIYPEVDMALRLGRKLVSHNFLDYISLDNSIEIRQIKLPESFAGVTVGDCNVRSKYGLNIIAIEHEKITNIEVDPQYRFCSGDIIVVIGKVSNIERLEKDM